MLEWSKVRIWWCLAAVVGIQGAKHSQGDVDVFLDWKISCMVTTTMGESQVRHAATFGVVWNLFCASFAKSSYGDAIHMTGVDAGKDESFVVDQIPNAAVITAASFENMKKPKALWMRTPSGPLDIPTEALLALKELRMLYLVNGRIVRNEQSELNNTLPTKLTHLILTTDFDYMNESLPDKFLYGLSDLLNFTATNFLFTSVPPDLFKYSPRLKLIDLSHNRIQDLTKEFFSGLVDMEVLLLHNNRLVSPSLSALSRLQNLQLIDLSHNPIGDFCKTTEANTVLFSIYYLRVMRLSDTGVTHVCYDWLNVFMGLKELDLSLNNISSLSCADLDMARGMDLVYPHVNLTGNPIDVIYCSRYLRQKIDRRGSFIPPLPKATIEMSTKLKCDCNSYWLRKMLVENRLPVDFHPVYEQKCDYFWYDCIPTNERS